MKFKQVQVSDVDTLLQDPKYIMQQKIDGNKAVVIVKDGVVEVLGKNGEPVKSTTSGPTAERLKAEFARYGDMLIHGEILGDRYYIFDTEYGPDWMPEFLFPSRWARLKETVNENSLVSFVTVWTILKKFTWDRVVELNLEGAVFKNILDNEDPIKVKITHTVDCVVLERDIGGKLNAVLGLFDGVEYKTIGRTSMIGKPDAQVGDTVEVKYLYAGALGNLVQPTVLCLRPDKPAITCTFDQLVFVNKEVI
jgi:ATP-dependent DNA ligase